MSTPLDDTAVAAKALELERFLPEGRRDEFRRLIETLAERIAAACLAFTGVERVAVTVHKPQAPIPVPFDDVELRIVRERTDA